MLIRSLSVVAGLMALTACAATPEHSVGATQGVPEQTLRLGEACRSHDDTFAWEITRFEENGVVGATRLADNFQYTYGVDRQTIPAILARYHANRPADLVGRKIDVGCRVSADGMVMWNSPQQQLQGFELTSE